jgi:hypothetical protein
LPQGAYARRFIPARFTRGQVRREFFSLVRSQHCATQHLGLGLFAIHDAFSFSNVK